MASSSCPSGTSDPLLLVSLRALVRSHQMALAQLSVFPSRFDTEGAAAVLGSALEGQAGAVLRVLRQHSLVEFDSARRQHYLHPAVRTAIRQLDGTSQRLVELATSR